MRSIFADPKVFIALLFAMNFYCQSLAAQNSEVFGDKKTTAVSSADVNSDKLVESFSDETKIGAAGKNKIEIFNYKRADRNRAVIKFYALAADKSWKLKQNFEFEKDEIAGLDARIKDFNNDGLKDFTYVSNVAARGSNEVRKLFIYNKKRDELIYVKNSEDFPNLNYNKTLNCLDAQRFYGGTATDFLKIEADTLKRFAYVETIGTERKVYTVDKNGKEKLLRADEVQEDVLERYKTFNPPKAYTAEELEQ